jgi:AraC-like DNA-binding protein
MTARSAVRAITRLMMLFLARRALPSAPSNANPLVTSVFQFIEARYRFPIGLADVARAVGRSPAYLTDLVRRETGRAVGQWIIERRMADARRLLLETEQGVGAVAEAAGYLDPRHFSAQFKRLHGTTPQAWRKSRRA